MAQALEKIARDLRQGGPTFIALAVVSKNLPNPEIAMTGVAKYDHGPKEEIITNALNQIKIDCENIGLLTIRH
jgi:hypothetical protein